MSEYRSSDTDISKGISSQMGKGVRSGKTIAKLALKGVRHGIALMGLGFFAVGVVVLLAVLIFMNDFEIRGSNLDYANEPGSANEVEYEGDEGRALILSMSDQNLLVSNYYKLMSLQSFYKVLGGKPICLSDDPDLFSSVHDYYDKENLYYLSHNFLIAADEQMHGKEFRYPEQFIKPVAYDPSTMALLPITDGEGELVLESASYSEDGALSGSKTPGVWDYGLASVLTYEEHSRHETIRGNYTMKEVCVGGEIRVVPDTGEFSVDIPGSQSTIHVIDKAVNLSGTVDYDYQTESLYCRPLIEGRTNDPAEAMTWVKYGTCSGHTTTKIVDGQAVTETVYHDLYRYRGEGAVYESVPVESNVKADLCGDEYLRGYFGYYKTYVPESVITDFDFKGRSEEDWELIKRLDALNVFGTYSDPVRSGADIGAMIESDAYINALSYLPYFEEYGAMFDVDPSLLMAIAAWESEGVHTNQDRTDGFGLMGIDGAGTVLKEIKAKDASGKQVLMKIENNGDISEVKDNVKAGAMLFRQYLDYFSGNEVMALQAYNNGVGAVKSMAESYGQSLGLSWVKVAEDRFDAGWLEERSSFAGDGDVYYLEHVLGYYVSENKGFDVVSSYKSMSVDVPKGALKSIFEAVGGSVQSLFGLVADVFSSSGKVNAFEHPATEADMNLLLGMTVAYDNQVSFTDAEKYLNQKDSGDANFKVGFLHLGNSEYMGFFGGQGETFRAAAALLDGFSDPIDTTKQRYYVSSFFTNGEIRTDVNTGRAHNGIDIGMGVGTKLYAAADGIVIDAGRLGASAGLGVVIQHEDAIITQYYHMSTVVVSKGARVKQGGLLGESGNTGFSTGPHLHFGVQINGRYVDPLAYFFQSLL